MAETNADLREQVDSSSVEEADPAAGTGSSPGPGAGPEDEQSSGPVVRDKRRLDPDTGKVRAAYSATSDAGAGTSAADAATTSTPENGTARTGDTSAELTAARARAEELLGDLQRLQAEYVNYRRRVDRDRELVRDLAIAGVLESLLPVLDDVHLARQHGDLESGPFASIADKLESTLARFGLERYGEVGEVFDPIVHEALMHTPADPDDGPAETTVTQIMQPGYRTGDRLLRPARVAVTGPS